MLKFFLFLAFLFSSFFLYQQWSFRAVQVFANLPNFEAVSALDRKPLSKQNFAGTIWVSGFIFTRCGGPCPLLMRKMVQLEKELPQQVHFAVFTVDPNWDSAEVFTEYAQQWPIDFSRWTFVTGDRKNLYKLYEEGFKISALEKPEAQESERFIHSSNLVLLDAQARVRGYYATTDDLFIENLKKDIRLVSE